MNAARNAARSFRHEPDQTTLSAPAGVHEAFRPSSLQPHHHRVRSSWSSRAGDIQDRSPVAPSHCLILGNILHVRAFDKWMMLIMQLRTWPTLRAPVGRTSAHPRVRSRLGIEPSNSPLPPCTAAAHAEEWISAAPERAAAAASTLAARHALDRHCRANVVRLIMTSSVWHTRSTSRSRKRLKNGRAIVRWLTDSATGKSPGLNPKRLR